MPEDEDSRVSENGLRLHYTDGPLPRLIDSGVAKPSCRMCLMGVRVLVSITILLLTMMWASACGNDAGTVLKGGHCVPYCDLVGADLTEAWLPRADLRGADLTDARLLGAGLYGAELSDANLTEAILTGANLVGANLKMARLWETDLRRADLRGADLTDAILLGADLTGADLTDANLDKADLTDADLLDANLDGAIGADFSRANNVPNKYLKD